MTVRDAEQRELPTVGEKQHVLDHGLRQHSLVRNEPKCVNPVLERFDCSNRILWGTDLTGDELDAFVTRDGLGAPNQIAGFGVVEYDADTLCAELFEQPDLPLDGHVEAGPRDVLRVGTDDARRVENHCVHHGRRGRSTDNGPKRPDADSKDEVRLHLRVDLVQLLTSALDVAIHVVNGHGLLGDRTSEAPDRFIVFLDAGAHEDGHARGRRRGRLDRGRENNEKGYKHSTHKRSAYSAEDQLRVDERGG